MSKPILDDAEYAEFLRALANKDTKAFRSADNRLQGLISQLSPDDNFHLFSRIIAANFNAVRLYVDKSKDIYDMRMTRKNLLNGSASYSPGKIKTFLPQNSILSAIFISIADAYDTAKYEILKLDFWEGHRTDPHTSPFALYSLANNYDLKLKKFNALKKQARKAMLRIADMAAALNFIDYAQDVRDEMAARLLRFNRFLKDVFSMPIGEEKHIINGTQITVWIYDLVPTYVWQPHRKVKDHTIIRCSWTNVHNPNQEDQFVTCAIHPVTSITCVMPHMRFTHSPSGSVSISLNQFGRNFIINCPVMFQPPKTEEEFEANKKNRLDKLRHLKQCADDFYISTYLPEIISYVEKVPFDNYENFLGKSMIAPSGHKRKLFDL